MYRPANQQPGLTMPQQMRQVQQPSAIRAQFFSQKNYTTLQRLLVGDFQKRQGLSLNEKQADRLERALEHYIEEVYKTQGDRPIEVLNSEVLRTTAQDFNKYIQRQNAVVANPQTPTQTIMNKTIYQDTGQRFEIQQQERQETKALMPAVPEFRISLDDDGPSSVDLYERAKKAREAEATRLANSAKDALGRMDQGLQQRIGADDAFRQGQANQNKSTELLLVERQQAVQPLDMPLVVPPDGRELFLTGSLAPRDQGDANGNSTTALPEFMSPLKSNLPQDYLIRQPSTVSYKEIENNLFVYSADRDWLKNISENRYSFTVNFDPANNGQGYYPQVRVQEKFKNIVRIELVKAILPIEGLNVLVQQESGSSNTAYQSNVLSYPFVTVRIPELENNNYGSDNFIDRAFGVLQYDANWFSDPGTYPPETDSRGYTALIPKFLKCQKVYTPAPLSTLQRLTISLLRPDGQPISTAMDTLDVSAAIIPIGDFSPYNGSTSAPPYILIQTRQFFSRFQVAVGDTLRFANTIYDTSGISPPPYASTFQDFGNWLNADAGHQVVAIGCRNGTTFDPVNAIGYANLIVLQNSFASPTTGQTGYYQFGGTGGDIGAALNSAYTYLMTAPNRFINQSRQTQLVFRVITREMDPVAQLRPDNM
jgi:hypothetical protein